MDIWSLGLISVFVLKGQSLCDLYISFKMNSNEELNLNLSPIIDFSEEHFERSWLSVQGEKEKSFIEDCLRVDPSVRWSASRLQKKSIFSTHHSTISLNARETKTGIRNQLTELTRLIDQGVTVEHLTDLLTTLVNQIQNIPR